MNETTQARVLYCTCPDARVAERIASALVDRRLAACVNIFPQVVSIYRWREKVEKDSEVLLMIKSTAANVQNTIEVIISEHPYELPEVIAVPIVAGNPPYLSWIFESTEN